MAHVKAAGTTKGNRDSKPKHLGVKVYGGAAVEPGNIIIRQKGTKFYAGRGVAMGRDFSIYAISSGIVQFIKRLGKTRINVLPAK